MEKISEVDQIELNKPKQTEWTNSNQSRPNKTKANRIGLKFTQKKKWTGWTKLDQSRPNRTKRDEVD